VLEGRRLCPICSVLDPYELRAVLQRSATQKASPTVPTAQYADEFREQKRRNRVNSSDAVRPSSVKTRSYQQRLWSYLRPHQWLLHPPADKAGEEHCSGRRARSRDLLNSSKQHSWDLVGRLPTSRPLRSTS